MSWKTAAASTALVLSLASTAPLSTAVAAGIDRVGITVGTLGNPFFAATDNGIKALSQKITPDAKLTFVSCDYDLNKQFTQIDNFVASGAKIILVNAADPVAIAPALLRAKKAGVVIGAFDVAAKGADVTVMTDNEKAGEEACQDIVDRLPGGKGDVAILNGPQVSSIKDRVAGCRKVLAAHPGINLVSSEINGQASRDGALQAGQELLTRYPHVNAIFAINDPTAIGLDLAARQMHNTSFFITSVDGSPDGIAQMKQSGSLIKSTAAQDPARMASEAYQFAVDLTRGKKPAQAVTLIAPTLITSANVGSYKGWND
jgi:ribose transport system substrate-binding protein